MLKCDFRHRCSSVNLLHNFQNTFSKGHLWRTASDLITEQKLSLNIEKEQCCSSFSDLFVLLLNGCNKISYMFLNMETRKTGKRK